MIQHVATAPGRHTSTSPIPQLTYVGPMQNLLFTVPKPCSLMVIGCCRMSKRANLQGTNTLYKVSQHNSRAEMQISHLPQLSAPSYRFALRHMPCPKGHKCSCQKVVTAANHVRTMTEQPCLDMPVNTGNTGGHRCPSLPQRCHRQAAGSRE